MSERVVVQYVWLDEDGEQVSPTHRNFGTALGFVNGWHKSWQRINDRHPQPEHLRAMTRSGKPPARLVRVLVTTTRAPLDEHEQRVVEAMLEARS